MNDIVILCMGGGGGVDANFMLQEDILTIKILLKSYPIQKEKMNTEINYFVVFNPFKTL